MNNAKTLTERIQFIKARLDLVEAISVITGVEFQQSSNTAWPAGENVCPCGEHRDNFRINTATGRSKCFTPGCNVQGDLFDTTMAHLNLSIGAAVEHIESLFEAELAGDDTAAESAPARPMTSQTPEQAGGTVRVYPVRGILNPTEADFKAMAAYQTAFRWGFTPTSAGYRHMVVNRRHLPEILNQEGIGFLDQSLSYRLRARTSPKTTELLTRYGLLTASGGDVARQGLVSFPLKDREGRICGFRFKDPQKQFMAQQRREGILNGVMFLGEHTLKDLPLGSRVLVVEGESDWLSLREAGWKEGLLATCGQLSHGQIEWLRNNLNGYQLVTAFDNDHGGEDYRLEVANQLAALKPIQYVPPVDDPDAFLKCIGTLDQLISEGSKWNR